MRSCKRFATSCVNTVTTRLRTSITVAKPINVSNDLNMSEK